MGTPLNFGSLGSLLVEILRGPLRSPSHTECNNNLTTNVKGERYERETIKPN
jgi:hypothetical protein